MQLIQVYLTFYYFYTMLFRGIAILKIKTDCLQDLFKLLNSKTKYNVHNYEIKTLPTINYMDPFSLKSIDNLRKIFFKHWNI